jgi:hypothetical protein
MNRRARTGKQKEIISLEMSCSAAGNTGFIEFAGPIQPSELKAITVTSWFPLTFAFAPRTTIPTLLSGNQIEEGVGNTCIYQGKRYHLVNVQLCSPLHKGYKLPGETQTPVGECIVTYAPTSDQGSVSGILLCFPIYDSGTPAYDGYLDQIVNDTEISCGYENEVGKTYEGADQNTINDTTLRHCVKACCDDSQCLAYSFGGGTCHIKHTIPNLLSTGDTTVSGKIKRGMAPSCSSSNSSSSSNPNSLVSTLESLLYQPNGTTTHSVMAYATCFETQKPATHSLYVMVFPKGIRMRSSSYQQLLLRTNGSLPTYRIPPVIRGGEPTLLRYRMDNGRKVPTEFSAQGEIYRTTVSTCTEEFQTRFGHFLLPSRSSASSASSKKGSALGGSNGATGCGRLTTEQYKCVPFNEATDLSGNIVIPGNSTLEDILKKQKESKEGTSQQGKQEQGSLPLAAETIEGIIGGGIGGILLGYAVYRGMTYIFNRPT